MRTRHGENCIEFFIASWTPRRVIPSSQASQSPYDVLVVAVAGPPVGRGDCVNRRVESSIVKSPVSLLSLFSHPKSAHEAGGADDNQEANDGHANGQVVGAAARSAPGTLLSVLVVSVFVYQRE